MNSHARRLLALGMLMSSVCAVPGFALDLLYPFRRVEADPKKSYRLTEEQGPWLIVAASFFGDQGEIQAHKLALELRSEYKLHAYVYKKEFDYGRRLPGRGIDKWGRPKRMKHLHTSQFQEVAVLVGDFRAGDDPDAQRTLKKLKYTRPECLELEEVGTTHQSLAGWRWNHCWARSWSWS